MTASSESIPDEFEFFRSSRGLTYNLTRNSKPFRQELEKAREEVTRLSEVSDEEFRDHWFLEQE